MIKINELSRSIISAIALLLLGGTCALVSADDEGDEATELGSVTSTASGIPRTVQFDVYHPDGLEKVSWYKVHPKKFEDSKDYSCSKTTSDKISLPRGSRLDPHMHHHHYVVIEPCKGKTETFKAIRYDNTTDTDAKFEGFGNLAEDDNSSIALQVTDINLDGLPDIVVVDNSSVPVTPTIMLGNGDGTFEKIIDSVTSEFDPNTSANRFQIR